MGKEMEIKAGARHGSKAGMVWPRANGYHVSAEGGCAGMR